MQGGRTLQPSRKAAADQQLCELAWAVPANRIICGLFGVAPSLWLNSTGREPATSFLRDAATPRGFDGKLSALRILGKLYTCGKRGRWAINRAGMIAATAGPSCTAAQPMWQGAM